MSNASQGPWESAASSEELFVRELIRKLVGEMAPPGSPEVRPGRILRDELGFDSVREVEITFILEELFGFEALTVDDSPEMQTVEDLEIFTLDMIAQRRATVPTQSEIDRVLSLVAGSARPS